MRTGAVALVVLLLFWAQAAAQASGTPDARPFSISSLNTAFGVQGEFEGEYRVYPGWVEVKVTKANIRVSEHCPYKGRRLLAAVKLGLATSPGGKSWKIARESQEFLLEQVMRPGDVTSLGELYFHIQVDDATDLSKHWLVAEMEDIDLDTPVERRQKGYAFAHSCRDLFTRAN